METFCYCSHNSNEAHNDDKCLQLNQLRQNWRQNKQRCALFGNNGNIYKFFKKIICILKALIITCINIIIIIIKRKLKAQINRKNVTNAPQ